MRLRINGRRGVTFPFQKLRPAQSKNKKKVDLPTVEKVPDVEALECTDTKSVGLQLTEEEKSMCFESSMTETIELTLHSSGLGITLLRNKVPTCRLKASATDIRDEGGNQVPSNDEKGFAHGTRQFSDSTEVGVLVENVTTNGQNATNTTAMEEAVEARILSNGKLELEHGKNQCFDDTESTVLKGKKTTFGLQEPITAKQDESKDEILPNDKAELADGTRTTFDGTETTVSMEKVPSFGIQASNIDEKKDPDEACNGKEVTYPLGKNTNDGLKAPGNAVWEGAEDKNLPTCEAEIAPGTRGASDDKVVVHSTLELEAPGALQHSETESFFGTDQAFNDSSREADAAIKLQDSGKVVAIDRGCFNDQNSMVGEGKQGDDKALGPKTTSSSMTTSTATPPEKIYTLSSTIDSFGAAVDVACVRASASAHVAATETAEAAVKAFVMAKYVAAETEIIARELHARYADLSDVAVKEFATRVLQANKIKTTPSNEATVATLNTNESGKKKLLDPILRRRKTITVRRDEIDIEKLADEVATLLVSKSEEQKIDRQLSLEEEIFATFSESAEKFFVGLGIISDSPRRFGSQNEDDSDCSSDDLSVESSTPRSKTPNQLEGEERTSTHLNESFTVPNNIDDGSGFAVPKKQMQINAPGDCGKRDDCSNDAHEQVVRDHHVSFCLRKGDQKKRDDVSSTVKIDNQSSYDESKDNAHKKRHSITNTEIKKGTEFTRQNRSWVMEKEPVPMKTRAQSDGKPIKRSKFIRKTRVVVKSVGLKSMSKKELDEILDIWGEEYENDYMSLSRVGSKF